MTTARNRMVTGLALAALAVAGCGNAKPKPLAAPQKAREALRAVRAAPSAQARVRACASLPEGYGRMGVCVPATPAVPGQRLPLSSSPVRGIDTSHWDYCSSSIVRAPRFWFVALGDGSYIDQCAPVVYGMLKRAGIPHGFYYFVRPGYSAQWSADRAAFLARRAGWSPQDGKTLVVADDAEALFNCSTIAGFDQRAAADLGIPRVVDYDAPGLWPGCSRPGELSWTAEYGSSYSTLRGLPSTWAWQHTDGQVGAQPHCWGVCGDVDLLVGSLNQALAVPPAPPIPADFYGRCSRLDAITYWKLHGGHGHVSPAQHQQAVRIRKWLALNRIGCTRQPHSLPYRYPKRRGALA